MSRYFSARDKYKPDKIGILLIAESPPASGGYFYFETATGRGGLFVETMKALQMIPEDKGLRRGSDKKPLLKAFKDGGFFVIDVSYEPVNDKKGAERKLAIKKELPRLVSDVKKLDPSGIVIVKCSLYKPVREALEEAGFGGRILNKEALPFPSHGHQKTYRKTLESLVAGEPW